jgi:hypothetical protein
VVEALDRPAGPGEAPWAASLRLVEHALVAKNPSDARRALQQAYLEALGSRRWDGLVAVGDSARRIGATFGATSVYDPTARHAYLVALFRARHDRSVEGVLRVADAFYALGDTAVVEQCLSLARGLHARSQNDVARAHMAALEQRLAERSFASGPHRIEPF